MMYGNPVSAASDCVSIVAYMFAKIVKVWHITKSEMCFLFCGTVLFTYLCIRKAALGK